LTSRSTTHGLWDTASTPSASFWGTCSAARIQAKRSGGAPESCGTLHALTVVHRPPSAASRLDVPYAAALADLDEGFRMMANVVGGDPERVAIGDRVAVTFERRGEITLPQFQPCARRGEDLSSPHHGGAGQGAHRSQSPDGPEPPGPPGGEHE